MRNRYALISDIHGNTIALDAVLNAVKGQVDGYWILGDLCAIGYDPVGVLERLDGLPNAHFVRGNADRYLVTGERPKPTFDDAAKNPAVIPTLAEVAGNFAWTQGYLEARGWLDWLKKLLLEQRLTLPDGTRVLLVHAAPGTDDGRGLNPGLTDDELQADIDGSEADLICVGHFHMPMDRVLTPSPPTPLPSQMGLPLVAGTRGENAEREEGFASNVIRVINPGSVSNPLGEDWRAAYAILTAGEQGYHVEHFRAVYDRQAAIEATQRCSNPGRDFMVRALRGEIRARWMARWDGVTHLPRVSERFNSD